MLRTPLLGLLIGLLIGLLLVPCGHCAATPAAANDSVDEALFSVRYKMRFVNDTTKTKRRRETMVLLVGRRCSKFYSYTKYVTDSVLAVDKANGASIDVMLAHRRQYGTSWITYQIFKREPAGRLTTLDAMASAVHVRVEEDLERPAWTLLADTATVMAHACHKATCYFRGRQWVAWFTTEVPVSDGPWKLHGLPGLILEAYDEQDHYHFSATALTRSTAGSYVAMDADDYETVTAEQYRKLQELENADPIGFAFGADRGIKVYDESMNEVSFKNRPRNPIERE